MKLLLDTHAFIWSAAEPERLSPRVREACEDLRNELLLSVVSLWEIQLKSGAGRLRLHRPLRELVQEHQRANVVDILPLRAAHVYAMAELPRIHKDPFDRLLVAQAVVEDAFLVSADATIAEYPVKVFW